MLYFTYLPRSPMEEYAQLLLFQMLSPVPNFLAIG